MTSHGHRYIKMIDNTEVVFQSADYRVDTDATNYSFSFPNYFYLKSHVVSDIHARV